MLIDYFYPFIIKTTHPPTTKQYSHSGTVKYSDYLVLRGGGVRVVVSEQDSAEGITVVKAFGCQHLFITYWALMGNKGIYYNVRIKQGL